MAEGTIAILGGRGMLGTDVGKLCTAKFPAVTVLDLPEFDITNNRQLKEVVGSFNIIINCAAFTDVDGAESEYERAYEINARAVGELGKLAKQTNKYVLHISTDFVFDGASERPYTETDEPNPINEYGRTKLASEEQLIESGCRCCILRVEWTYGRDGENFVTKLLKQATNQTEMKVVNDQIGSPTATTEAAGVICRLIAKKAEGIFHFASAGFVSRFDMAKFIFEKKEIAVKLTGCRSADFPTPAKRPLNSCFDCSKIMVLLDEPIKRWEPVLEDFLRTVTA